jgi:anti-anti-sigma regulatory factor
MLSCSVHRRDGHSAILTPPAEIDLTNAEQLQDELIAVLDRGMT